MRSAFAHDAVLAMEADGDIRAPGAAVTVELCGHWDHEPPCRFPHHTDVVRDGRQVRLRMLFASEPDAEADVRERIGQALARSELTDPDGATTRWRVVDARPGDVRDDERAHADRLVASS